MKPTEILMYTGLAVMLTILLFCISCKFFMYILTCLSQFAYLSGALIVAVYYMSRQYFIYFVTMVCVLALLNHTRFYRLQARKSQLKHMIKVCADDEERCLKYREELESYS